MKTTGMTRRIDELGRIVIPKEIRKSLKIKEGESLEIIVNEEQIILQKHDVFNSDDKNITNLIEALNKTFKIDVIITDRNKVINVTDNLKEYVDKEISDFVNKLLNERMRFINNASEEVEIIKNGKLMGYFVMKPLIIDNDLLGMIIIKSNTKNFVYEDLCDVLLYVLECQYNIN